MPGSPPTSVSEPGTMPPPSTRSSSPTPLSTRGLSSSTISLSSTGSAPLPRACLSFLPATASGSASMGVSVSVFHWSQAGHLPSQRVVSYPHSEQTYLVLSFAMLSSA